MNKLIDTNFLWGKKQNIVATTSLSLLSREITTKVSTNTKQQKQ